MNLVQFLKNVDNLASKMSKEQIVEVLHEAARKLPEDNRVAFLTMMKSVSNAIKNQTDIKDKKTNLELKSEIKNIIKILEEINNGKKCLDSEYSENYDDWDEYYEHYYEDDFTFTDPKSIILDIEIGFKIVHKCIDNEVYKDGLKLANKLYHLEISIDGDYNSYDGSNFRIEDLCTYKLLDENKFKKFVDELLFLTYAGNKLSERAKNLYYIMEYYNNYNVNLESIMQLGNNVLLDFNEFLSLWIEYLGNTAGLTANKLLTEALSLISAGQELLNAARKYYEKHPELYERILEEGLCNNENDKMFSIGMEAIKTIPISYVIRSKVALLTAEYGLKINDIKATETCWIEAFKSDTSFVNYLRIRFFSKDYNLYATQVKQIYNEMYEKNGSRSEYHTNSQNYQKENTLIHNDYRAILFFEEEFEKVIKIGLNKREPLGWSGTFMKAGITLFLMLLYKGNDLPVGLYTLIDKIITDCNFTSKKFVLGTNVKEENDKEQFIELFINWKQNIQISEENYNIWMNKLEQLISNRIAGIMEKSRTKYYNECAAFIAAFGEALESNGIPNGKANFIEKYRVKYFRRHSFTAELKSFQSSQNIAASNQLSLI